MSTEPVTTFIAGGLAGAAATVITCPLEVIKTRLQSTVGQSVVQEFRLIPGQLTLSPIGAAATHHTVHDLSSVSHCAHQKISYVRHMLRTEGTQALFKGVTPSLVGSVPTRALYFCAYSQFKNFYNGLLTPDSSQVHMCSAISAGLLTTTLTSPIWVVKTQMQLHNRPGQFLTARMSARQIFQMDGFRGFYRGLSASYAGVTETAIHFVLYEKLKKWMTEQYTPQLRPWHYMIAASSARMAASCLCYPHEVCRTRLRQQVHPSQRRYHSFFQTLMTVWKEEGAVGLYGGMSAHLIRVLPYHAIMFCTYETIVKLISRYRETNL